MFIVDASSKTTLAADLAEIAMMKNVGKTDTDALSWLATDRENWLLIFDNADDTGLNLGSYFPRCNHGNIIITTRNQNVTILTDPSSSVDVSQMSPEDATDLLLNVSGVHSKERNLATDFVEASDLLKLRGKLLI